MAVALLTKTKRYAEARSYLDSAIPVARTVGSREMLANAYRELERLDSINGDWNGAYRNHRMHVLYRDSIYNASNTEETTRLRMQYDFDKVEAAAKAEQEKKDAVAAEALRRKERAAQRLHRGSGSWSFLPVSCFTPTERISKSTQTQRRTAAQHPAGGGGRGAEGQGQRRGQALRQGHHPLHRLQGLHRS